MRRIGTRKVMLIAQIEKWTFPFSYVNFHGRRITAFGIVEDRAQKNVLLTAEPEGLHKKIDYSDARAILRNNITEVTKLYEIQVIKNLNEILTALIRQDVALLRFAIMEFGSLFGISLRDTGE